MKLPVFYTLFMIAFVLGCTDEVPKPVSRPASGPDITETHNLNVARLLSQRLAEPDFRLNLKEKLLEKFDGDFNVLYSQLDDLPQRPDDPLLQVAMPSLTNMNASQWDAGNDVPLVVYRPASADLSILNKLTAFDSGREVEFDITREPENLVIVLSHNERTIYTKRNQQPQQPDGRTCTLTPVVSDNNYDFFLKQESYECGNILAIDDTPTTSTGCDRDEYNRQDHLVRAKFATIGVLRHAEHYLDGNPEVFFIITLASKNPSGFSSLRKSYPSSDRSEWKDCGIFNCKPEWYDKRLPTFNWDRSLFGDLVRYDWFEEDYSKAKIDLTLGLSTKIAEVSVSGGVKITINEKDYFLDQDFVSYCDDANGIGTTYNTGKFLFTVNHQ